jgi:broad specificity phosphatase PhoE
MSEIYLIRHAQASFGGDNYDKLSALGIKQAEILADYFVRAGLKFHAVYCGSMERQIGTAKSVMSRLWGAEPSSGLRIADEFNEYDFQSVIKSLVPHMIREDSSISEALPNIYTDRNAFQRVFEQAILWWISGRYDLPGIETWQAFSQRVRKGVNRVMEENGPKKKIVLFTSGGVVSAVIQMALGLSDEDTIRLSWQIRNTSVSILKYSDKRLGLSSFNSVAHLEIHNEAELLTYR